MKKLLLVLTMLMAFTYTFSQVEGIWKMAPQAGALGVGWEQGNMGWWSNSLEDVTTRACFFDDTFVFNEDGSFNNVMDAETWLEGWQGVSPDQCGTPVYPHDGSNAATWVYDDVSGTLTLTGVGAHLGIPKAANGFELTDPSQAPDAITYIVFDINATSMTVDINVGGGWWRFIMEKLQAGGSDATLSDLQVDGETIPGFNPIIDTYEYGLPEGTVTIPQITSVTTTDPEATSIITQAVSIPGDATVVVTAADGVTIITYTVSYMITTPNSAPAVPTYAPSDVISVYCEEYTNIDPVNYNPAWGQQTIVTVDDLIAGNLTMKYENLNYQGIDFDNNPQDVSGYEYLHIDFWTGNSTNLRIYAISATWPNQTEVPFEFTLNNGNWVSVDIPLSHFSDGGVNLSDVRQFKTEGDGDIWIDNLVFWKSPGSGILTFDPQDGSTNVAVDVNPTLSFSIPVEMADGSSITNGDIPSLLTFKESDASGADVPFSGTINANEDLISVIPTSVLDVNHVYYLALNNEVIRWQGGDLIAEQSVTFTTVSDPFNLPVTFDDPLVNYDLVDFGGNISEIIVDPLDPSNNIVQTIKTESAELWAGTTVGGTDGFTEPIPFAEGYTFMSVAIWSPTAGTPIRLKVEDSTDPTISVETETLTTVAEEWEILVFDFSNEAPGTAPINFDNTYNKASIFFNFGTTGAQAGEQTYFWDDMEFADDPGPGNTQSFSLDLGYQFVSSYIAEENMDMLVLLEDILTDNLAYVRDSDGGMLRKIGPNWINGIGDWTSTEGYLFKVYGPETFAFEGDLVPADTPISIPTGFRFVSYLPVTPMDAMIAFETIIGDDLAYIRDSDGNMLRKIGPVWVNGIGDANPGEGYLVKMLAPATLIYPGGSPSTSIIEDFEGTPPAFTVFGGIDAIEVVPNPDPTGANTTNTTAKMIKTAGAEVWAGCFFEVAEPLDFDTYSNVIVKTWSPVSGKVIKLKLENADASITHEVDITNTVATGWEVLNYDFSGAPVADYVRIVIFFDFGNYGDGTEYYFDEFELSAGAKSSVLISNATHFNFNGGNAADPVYTIYVNGLQIGDEVAAYDQDVLVGATKITSENELFNALPVFSTVTEGQGYVAGNPIILKVYNAKTNELISVDFEMENIYNSYNENVYPSNDGEFSVVNISKSSVTDDLSLSIYPNPANGIVNINSQTDIDRVMIFNCTGQIVYDEVSNNKFMTINTESFKQGLYIIRVETSNGLKTEKLTIK